MVVVPHGSVTNLCDRVEKNREALEKLPETPFQEADTESVNAQARLGRFARLSIAAVILALSELQQRRPAAAVQHHWRE